MTGVSRPTPAHGVPKQEVLQSSESSLVVQPKKSALHTEDILRVSGNLEGNPDGPVTQADVDATFGKLFKQCYGKWLTQETAICSKCEYLHPCMLHIGISREKANEIAEDVVEEWKRNRHSP